VLHDESSKRAPPVQVDVCGRFGLVVAGVRRDESIHQQGRMALAFLAVHQARPVSRDELELAIWGEGDTRDRGAALNTILSRLRRALGPEVIQSHSRTSLQLADYVVVDYHVAFGLLAEAQDALRRASPEEAAAAADRSLHIAQGGVLHGESAPWLEDLRRELTELGLRARECIAEASLLRGGPELGTAADRAREIVRVEPLRESAHGVLMRALEAQGNVAQALTVYEQLRERLGDELGVTPGVQLRALHSRLLGAPQPVVGAPPAAAALQATTSPLALRSARVRAPFVGREAELHALRQLFDASETGSSRLALLEGEPGIGKTRLSVQFAQDCERRGALTLYGRCDPETVVPYQPFVEALRGALGAGVLAPLRERIPAHLAELARVLPELAAVGVLAPLRERIPTHLLELARVLPELAEATGVNVPALVADDSAERYRLFDAVATVLAEVAGAQPMLLILDDLHWADKATLLVLRQVMRSAGEAPMLMLGTYRDTERGDALLDVLADLHREHVLHRISLTGLDEGNASELIEQISEHGVSSQLSKTLWEECRGNPFFLEEMVRHQGLPERAAGGPDALPNAVADVIGRRLARLSPEACMILEIACVAGNRFSIDVIERLGELSEDVLDAVLCETIEAHVIEEVPGVYGRFVFEHALIPQTLYERLTHTRRARLHLRVAEALEDQSTDDASRLAELAHHFVHAPPSQGRAKAAHYAELAARHALDVLAFEDAVRHYDMALSLLGDAGAEPRHELLLALGDAQFKAGDARGARVTFREAGEIARKIASPIGFAKAALGCTRRWVIDEEMFKMLEEALQWLGDGEPVLQSRLLSRLAIKLSLARDRARVSALSEQALAIARRTADRGAVCDALTARHLALWSPESLGERQHIATEFLRLATDAGSARLAIQGHQWHLMDLFELGDIQGADVAVEAFCSLAQERRLPADLRWMRFIRATRLLLAGRYEKAEEHSRAALELGNRVGDPSASSVFALQMITIRRDRGGLEEFENDVRVKVADDPEIPGWRCVLAHMLCELGRLDDARRELDDLSANEFGVLPRDALWLGAIAYCAEVAARLDKHAAVLYELLAPFPDRNVVVGWSSACLGSSSRPLALLAATLRREDDAIAHFENAIAMNERMGAAPWLARTRVEYGKFLLGQGTNAERATALIRQGLASAGRLRMAPLINNATRALGHQRT
jgi:DNA-binding SARP family transcriptional activator/tetratricopeptide (TPR) repeat protein